MFEIEVLDADWMWHHRALQCATVKKEAVVKLESKY
jgi:hypothetical protein